MNNNNNFDNVTKVPNRFCRFVFRPNWFFFDDRSNNISLKLVRTKSNFPIILLILPHICRFFSID